MLNSNVRIWRRGAAGVLRDLRRLQRALSTANPPVTRDTTAAASSPATNTENERSSEEEEESSSFVTVCLSRGDEVLFVRRDAASACKVWRDERRARVRIEASDRNGRFAARRGTRRSVRGK